jgi:hypothetical protein
VPGIGSDRRKSPRVACRGPAKIYLGAGTIPRDCTVLDISEGGMRLIADRVDSLPAEFTVILSNGRGRECRMAWRIGCEFGVQFIDGLALDGRPARAA